MESDTGWGSATHGAMMLDHRARRRGDERGVEGLDRARDSPCEIFGADRTAFEVEVDVEPAEPAEFTAAKAGHTREVDGGCEAGSIAHGIDGIDRSLQVHHAS